MSSPAPTQHENVDGLIRRRGHICCDCKKQTTISHSRPFPPNDPSSTKRMCCKCIRKLTPRKPLPTMPTHRWTKFRHSSRGAQIAATWRAALHFTDHDIEIRGKVRSYDCMKEGRYTITQLSSDGKLQLLNLQSRIFNPLVEITENYFREQLSILHPNVFSKEALQRKPYFLNAMKLLWSKPREGKQDVHYDISQRCMAGVRYSCILFCTPSHHTAVPNAHADDMKVVFRDGDELTDQQYHENVSILRKVRFISEIVPAGSGITFHTNVAHHGVENMSHKHKRIVVFALFCPRMDKKADETQKFPLPPRPGVNMDESQ